MTAKTTMSYFRGSFIFAGIALVLGAIIGYIYGGPAGAIGSALQAALLVAVLSVLETSLSFDNAVVNATVLQNWDDRWRRIFLTWGIYIAVFGMRIVFPIAIVSVTTATAPWTVLGLAAFQPAEYAAKLTAVHHQVSFFGAAFLLMVGLEFFFKAKDHAWLSWIEKPLEKAGSIDVMEVAVTLLAIVIASNFVEASHQMEALIAGVFGTITYVVAHGLGSVLGGGEDDGAGAKIIKAGIGGFLYLELLDASFSFDGVIGAFALTNNLWIIALGLGVGAFFVRSMTIFLVDKGTLAEYRYLEHGAFYAILALAAIMFASGAGIHLPEWFTGLVGAGFIGAAFWHSVVANKQDAKAQALTA